MKKNFTKENLKYAIPKILIILFVVAGLVLISTICAPCDTGMNCRRTTRIAQAIFVGMGELAVFSIPFSISFKQADAMCLLLDLFGIIFSLASFANIYINKGCDVVTMKCYTETFPVIILVSFAVLMIYIAESIKIMLLIKKNKKADKDEKEDKTDNSQS